MKDKLEFIAAAIIGSIVTIFVINVLYSLGWL